MFKKQERNVDLEFFTIFDSKANAYGEPVFAKNKDVLLREVLTMFNRPEREKNPHYNNAEDFSIFKIGSYDKKTGLIEVQNLEHIANLHDLRALARPTVEQGALLPT